MKKKIMLLITFILLSFFNYITVDVEAEELPIDICVGGRWYQVTEMGDKVEWWKIDTDNMSDNGNSMLGSSYFEMKKDFKKSGLTISQIDNYMPTYEANRNFWGDNNFNQRNDKIDKFLNKHYSTYKKPSNYNALKSTEEEAKYSFKTTFLSKKCNRTSKADGSYEVFSCPTNNMQKKYNTNTFTSAVSKLEFDIATEKFKTTVSDKFTIDVEGVKEQIDFGGKLKIRVLTGDYDNKANYNDYDYSSIVKPSDLVYTLNSGSSVTLSFPKETDIRLEFFINPNTTLSGGDANCVGAYLGFISFSTPGYAEVTNTKKDTSGACKTFQNFTKIEDIFKKALVPECYSDKLDYFTDYLNWNETSISTKVNEIINEFNQIGTDNNANLNNLKCHYNQLGKWETAESTKTYMYDPVTGGEAKGYWAASCKETVKVEYDQPKQVIAGTGFSYTAKLNVTRTCTPVLLKSIVKKPKCKYKIECWGGPSNHHGEGGAGPNEDFDDCISACDGGEYSQECINACYKAVYENNNSDKVDQTYSFIDVIKGASKLISEGNTPKLTKVSYNYKVGDKTPLGSVVAGIAADKICDHVSQKCTSKLSGITFVYDEGCDVNGESTMCYDVLVSDGNCSKDPEGDFQREMDKAKSEYDELVKALRKYEQSEDVEMSVIDSYKTDEDGKLKKTTWKDKLKKEETVTPAVTSGGKDVKYGSRTITVKNITVSKSYTVNLPKAHINVDKATVKYVKEGSGMESGYKDGGNKYYTDFKSGKYNDYSYGWEEGYSHNSAATINKKTGNNIGVLFKEIGTVQKSGTSGKQYTWDKIDIDCFYGLYNQFNILCEENVCTTPDPSCKGPNCAPVDLTCKEGDVCTKGIQYMFRQVNLNDLFTERNPRWNWRHTTKVGTSYTSNASEIIEKIETTGNDAYKHEPEYEFVITREDIRKIRDYNKNTAKSYQDYPGMTCNSVANSGIKVCQSGFMSEYTHSFRRNTELGQNTNRNG